MGLFWDKLKGLFGIKEENKVEIAPLSAEIAATTERYERDYRQDVPDIVSAEKWANERVEEVKEEWAKQVDPGKYKQSSGKDLELLKTTYVGFDPVFNIKLQHRKTKSQRKNWKHWRNRK